MTEEENDLTIALAAVEATVAECRRVLVDEHGLRENVPQDAGKVLRAFLDFAARPFRFRGEPSPAEEVVVDMLPSREPGSQTTVYCARITELPEAIGDDPGAIRTAIAMVFDAPISGTVHLSGPAGDAHWLGEDEPVPPSPEVFAQRVANSAVGPAFAGASCSFDIFGNRTG